MTHSLTKKIVKDAPAYLATAAGKEHYNKIFPNDTERNPYRRAEKFLGHYRNWSGPGSRGKYEELATKLGHFKEYNVAKVKKHYGNDYVDTAKRRLAKQAAAADALPQAQLPTSNNDVSNLSLSLSLSLSL
jgi:hypothetical protein